MTFPRPGWIRTVAYSLLPTVILLSILEFAFRSYDTITGSILSEDLLAGWYTSSTEGHPFLEYTSRRNFHGTLTFREPGKTFEVRTNSHGFRTREFYPKLPGQFRIVLMGDSWVWGYNAHQHETPAAVLEALLRSSLTEDIEVFSLGGVSYSGVRYAALARIYLDFLKPDIVIVALDQSDFEEDVARIRDYVTDESGAPLVLKRAAELAGHLRSHRRIVMDAEGKIRTLEESPNWTLRLRMGSSLFNHALEASQRLGQWFGRTPASRRREVDPAEIRRYGDPAAEPEGNLLRALPRALLHDVIPYPLSVAKERYRPTLRSLEYIKRECDKRGIALYLSSYPYPWMVSTREAASYQRGNFSGIYDLRGHRIHPQLVGEFAAALRVPHLDAYPVFERDPDGKYGDYDPHFNAAGHAFYARFLFDSIREDVRRVVCNPDRMGPGRPPVVSGACG